LIVPDGAEIRISDEDPRVVARLVRFGFTAQQAVAVTAQSTCHCLEVMQERRNFSAGEHGEILCWIKLGQLEGRVQRILDLTVEGPDGGIQKHAIPVVLDLMRHLNISTEMVMWDIRKSVEAKVIEIAVAEGFGTLSGFEVDHKAVIRSEMQAIDARHYRVVLHPNTELQKTSHSDLYLLFDTKIERMKKIRLPVVVAKP
jgi:hypothetical protein